MTTLVTVPPGAAPGTYMQITTTSGPLMVVVPPNTAPGATFLIVLPPPPPPVQVIMLSGHPLQVATLQPTDVLPLPARQLGRVYLGLGWRDKGTKVDLDCAVAGYDAAGTRLSPHTVWYQNLQNGKATLGKKALLAGKRAASSIVHSGDVLTGQAHDASELKDQERIYVWLHAVPNEVHSLAFEANVYTQFKTFADLESAYVRLVNAETEQELARMELAGSAIGGKAVALAQLVRAAGGASWQLHCLHSPREL